MAPIIIGLLGVVAAAAYFVYFAWASRRDSLASSAEGRCARWARRSAGVSVSRIH